MHVRRGFLFAGLFFIPVGAITLLARAGTIDVSINAGRARITLGRGPTTGNLAVDVGAIDLCDPPGAGLQLTVTDQLTFVTNLSTRGLRRLHA